jgi:hypothetical protein
VESYTAEVHTYVPGAFFLGICVSPVIANTVTRTKLSHISLIVVNVLVESLRSVWGLRFFFFLPCTRAYFLYDEPFMRKLIKICLSF